uniref:Uncharacterized protein MANES_03G199200 n=1 Tax=Rhizophora mucronata TaxID=61149 RepID=A0A2P2NBC4_RHIMU
MVEPLSPVFSRSTMAQDNHLIASAYWPCFL